MSLQRESKLIFALQHAERGNEKKGIQMTVTITIASKVVEDKRGVLWNEELSHHTHEDELREMLGL